MSEAEKRKCLVCGGDLKSIKDGTTKKFKAISCKSFSSNGNGCDYILYSNHTKLAPKSFTKEELLEMHDKAVAGESIRIKEFNCSVDVKSPGIIKGKGDKPDTNFYIKVQKDADIEEDV